MAQGSQTKQVQQEATTPQGDPMWMKLWFNLLVITLYVGLSMGLAFLFSPDNDAVSRAIIGGALGYGFGNVHFVLWFTFYTRIRKEAQDGQ